MFLINLRNSIIFRGYNLLFLFYQIEDVGDKIHATDRALIKEKIVGLMLSSPEQIQKQVKFV